MESKPTLSESKLREKSTFVSLRDDSEEKEDIVGGLGELAAQEERKHELEDGREVIGELLHRKRGLVEEAEEVVDPCQLDYHLSGVPSQEVEDLQEEPVHCLVMVIQDHALGELGATGESTRIEQALIELCDILLELELENVAEVIENVLLEVPEIT